MTLFVVVVTMTICSLFAGADIYQTTSFSETLKHPAQLVVHDLEKEGFGSMLLQAIGALAYQKALNIESLSIDYTTGLYKDPQHGDNWWEYYFEQPQSQYISHEQINIYHTTVSDHGPFYSHAYNDKPETRECAQSLIVKPAISQKIADFQHKHNFTDKLVIGVHYRGTDRMLTGSNDKTYKKISDVVQQTYKTLKKRANPCNIAIFVATDEEPFLAHMHSLFPGKIISYQSIRTSDPKKPVHFSNNNPFKAGEDALIDMMLLSSCDVMIATYSSLNKASRLWNDNQIIYDVKDGSLTTFIEALSVFDNKKIQDNPKKATQHPYKNHKKRFR